ncbi:MAG: TrkH family potassium uptake protein [Bacteroidales bacterium]|nr:TrkH family potassium uptake protein [Bacteroidales bacterium]
MLICIIFGLFPMIFVGKVEYLSFNEGISIVVYGWLITCVIGSLPYLMWGGEFTLINSWFESVSGFTTTGSSILNDVEKLPKGLLFWRSSTHWIGGLGVIMFVLLILPTSQNPRLTLINTEMSDISRSTFQYRARKTAYVLAMIYAGLTVMETLLLTLAGMGLFDAINHSFATIATGGFSTRNLSIAAYNQLSIEVIIMLFMILSGINFGILFNTVSGKSPNIFNSRIVRAYLFILLAGIVVATTDLYLEGVYSFSQSLRAAAFQVISLGTTTGFATQATEVWPSFTQLILIFFTIQCAMVGSTSGGLKFDRIFIFFKSIVKQVKMMKHPNAVITIKVDNISLDDQRESNVMNFIVLYVITFFITTLILSVFNTDLITAFSASIATLGNVGPGFGQVSSLGNYADLPVFSKLVLTFNMLLGRLEILSIIAFLTIRRKEF